LNPASFLRLDLVIVERLTLQIPPYP
jgi:hypothetical protein